MVLTDDENLARWLKARRNLCFGKKERFQHEDRGWNFRMTNVQAAIGCGQLEGIAGFLERKRTMARLYDEGLRGLPLQLPHIEPWAKSSVWMYAVVLDDRVSYDAAEFARRLSAEGIQTRPFFLGMHEQPVYQQMGFFKNERYPVAERIARRGLYLPSGQAITDEQIRQVLAVMRSVLVG
jgi:perosamine synthetase